jgi:DNA-binding NtrC family response regulator
VEDDPAIGRLLETLLRLENFDVMLVVRAQDAIAELEAGRYHLVVLDLILPDAGETVIGYLKRNRLEVLRSIVVISAHLAAVRAAMRGEFPEPICKFLAKTFGDRRVPRSRSGLYRSVRMTDALRPRRKRA